MYFYNIFTLNLYFVFNRCVDYVVQNIAKLLDNDMLIPDQIKSRILRQFISRSHVSSDVTFVQVLKFLVNPKVECIDLTLHSVDDEVLDTLTSCQNLNHLHLNNGPDISVTCEGKLFTSQI